MATKRPHYVKVWTKVTNLQYLIVSGAVQVQNII